MSENTSAAGSTEFKTSKIAELEASVIDKCRSMEDTLDQWIDIGRDLNELAIRFVAEKDASAVEPVKRLRKRKGAQKKPEGLRKEITAHLTSIVEPAGFDRKKVNAALQCFALEHSAAWIGQLKSEGKARPLFRLVRWHWQGCRLTKAGQQNIDTIHDDLASAPCGMENLTVRRVKSIVDAVLGTKRTVKDLARTAAKALCDALEGTDRQRPAGDSDIKEWLKVLFQESPRAAELIIDAVEAYQDTITTPSTSEVA